ncbi:MAG: TonB-dependent receptor [Schleiferiaceae bacterium]|nr:TonB-dependent receptor [Schleiferiaceae bacterium]
MKHAKTLLIALLFFSFSFSAWAQNATVRGFIYEKKNQNPVGFAAIGLKGTAFGASSGNDGYFQINNIPPGSYTLVISFVGFETIEKEVTLSAGQLFSEKFYLLESSQVLDDVVINVERQEMKTKVLTSVVSLSPKKIIEYSVGGDADLIRAVQVIPGVITTGDQGGQIYIRGGAPIQNLTLLDGMILYNPFHSIGFYSVFDTDILQSADIYTGGFQAEYGSRTSSVMDIRTRDGNRSRFAGKVSASTYMSKVLLEAPIGKKDKNGLAPASILISGKASYLDQVAPIIYPYVDNQFDGIPFAFADIYSKLALVSDNGSKINIYGFNFTDAVRLSQTQSINWASSGGGAYFKAIPAGSAVIMEGNFNVSNYFIRSTELEDRPRQSEIGSWNGGLDFTYLMRKNDELKFGIQLIGYSTDFTFTNALGRTLDQTGNSSELGSYFKYKYAQGRLLIEPGLRLQYYSSLGELSPEPRIGVKYNFNDRLRLKGSGGWYSQNLVAANSDRDVVNLFYGFLNGPENIPETFRGEEVRGRVQKARHIVLGFEYDLGNKIDINVEGYIKDFNQSTNVNRNQIFPNTEAYRDKPEIQRRDFLIEKGLARGIDFLVKWNEKRWNVFAGYSLSQIIRDDGITEYFPHFDRRHNTNIVFTYFIDSKKNWETNVRWNYGSGFPFTPTVGYYAEQPFVNPTTGGPNLNFDYTTENGEAGIIYGDLNSARLPQYHRLDITVRRVWKVRKYEEIDLSFGATNMYNRNNIFFFDRANFRRVDQLPIMPTAALSYKF